VVVYDHGSPTGDQFTFPAGGGTGQWIALAEGIHQLSLFATDSDSPARSAFSTNIVTVIYDKSPPAGTFAVPLQTVFSRGTIEFQVNATDNLTGVAAVAFAID